MYRNTRRPRYVSKKAVLGMIGVVSGVRLDGGQMGVSAPSLDTERVYRLSSQCKSFVAASDKAASYSTLFPMPYILACLKQYNASISGY